MVAHDQGHAAAENRRYDEPSTAPPSTSTPGQSTRALTGSTDAIALETLRRHSGPSRLFDAIVRPGSIRGKLIRILCVSLVLVLLLLGYIIAGQVGTFRTARTTTHIVNLALGVQAAVYELQQERGLTNGLLSGDNAIAPALTTQRPKTDRALATLNQTLINPQNADAGVDQIRAALSKLDDIAGVRSTVDDRLAQPSNVFQFYTAAIGALNDDELGLDQVQDPALRHGLQTLYAVAGAMESTAREAGLLAGVFAANKFPQPTYAAFTKALDAKQDGLSDYARYATPSENTALAAAFASPDAAEMTRLENAAVAASNGVLPARTDPATWWNSATTVIDGMRSAQQSVGHDVMARAIQLRNRAGLELGAMALLALAIIAVMIALVIGAARSVIDPVRLLARDANDMSVRRLPAAVAKLQSEDPSELARPVLNLVPRKAAAEIRVLAKALDRLQDTSLRLATEQALIRRNTTASLANLGRRNQNLVRRQLALISDFEREELDPSALANMFELDHLATRMRRNAESVLVLVGQTSPRVWSQPLPIADVIRAALSEVEDYRRVVLRRVDPAFVTGSVITDVAHMLAELVENGLQFSSPELEVEVYGRRMGNRYLLVVVDHGIGMPPAELAAARARLRDEENFLVAPTRFLGHYVVGRLANRLGVRVDLSESPTTGLTARILLPPDLLADESTMPPPAPPTLKPLLAQPARPEPAEIPEIPAIPATRTETPATPAPVPTQAATPAAAPAEAAPQARTPNGLVKRQSRRRTQPATEPIPAAPAPRTADRPTDGESSERTPSQVRSMLSAFQQGHQRGQLAMTGADAVAGREEEPSDT
ncbi:MAG TPA: nitrate- and nitrite sensing domain-containing protein [Pseudonocardiaceae bacterium]|nr:nitrate- and nitrite sensing domain-containing protein [Pseudonocardiaceae bacterium]